MRDDGAEVELFVAAAAAVAGFKAVAVIANFKRNRRKDDVSKIVRKPDKAVAVVANFTGMLKPKP